MARLRSELQSLLESLLGSDQVYFQPPPNVAMIYPCIVYKRDNSVKRFADNAPYLDALAYQVTVIDRNPDSEIPSKISALPLSRFNRFYTADGLNHDVFNLFF